MVLRAYAAAPKAPASSGGGCPDLSPQDQDCCHKSFGAAFFNQLCVAGKSGTKGLLGGFAPCKIVNTTIPIPCWALYGVVILVAGAVIIAKIK